MSEVPEPEDELEEDPDDDPDGAVATGLLTVWLLPPHPESATPSAAVPVINAILAFIVVASERSTDR
jgi:hypothetical protein